jgi:hypothetical protein
MTIRRKNSWEYQGFKVSPAVDGKAWICFTGGPEDLDAEVLRAETQDAMRQRIRLYIKRKDSK